MNTTVPTTPADRELTGYAASAALLRRLADGLDLLQRDKPPYVQIHIFPDDGDTEAVDAIAAAVELTHAKTEMQNAKWRYSTAASRLGMRFYINIGTNVDGPADPRDAEIERLRAENEGLRAAAPSFVDDDPTGLGYSREADDPTPTTAVPATIEGHAEFSGRASVPDVTLCLAEVEPATTCDEPIWWNAGADAWWHQSDEHFNHTATGPSVPPSDGCE